MNLYVAVEKGAVRDFFGTVQRTTHIDPHVSPAGPCPDCGRYEEQTEEQ